MRANRTNLRVPQNRRKELERRIVRGGVQDLGLLNRRIARGRPSRASTRLWTVGRHAPPANAKVATSEWDLARAQAGQATYRRIRAAIREAASSGQETVLNGSTELSSRSALAYSRQYMAQERITTVDTTLTGPALVIRPHAAHTEQQRAFRERETVADREEKVTA